MKVILGVVDNITNNLRRVEGEVHNFTNRTRQNFSNFSKNLAAGAAAYFSVNAIRDYFNESAKLYESQVEQDTKLQAVLKSTGNQIGYTLSELQNYASELQNVTTFEDDAIQGIQHTLLTMDNIGKDVFPRATELILDMATATGSLDQASQTVAKGLNDEMYALSSWRRIGISFTQQQKEMVKQYVQTNNHAKAQEILLDVLSKKYGNLARSMAQTDFGQIKQARNAIGDTQEIIGKEIIPLQLQWNAGLLEASKAAVKLLGTYNTILEVAGGIIGGWSLERIRVERFINESIPKMDKEKAKTYLFDYRMEKLREIEAQEAKISKLKSEADRFTSIGFKSAAESRLKSIDKEKQKLMDLEGQSLALKNALKNLTKSDKPSNTGNNSGSTSTDDDSDTDTSSNYAELRKRKEESIKQLEDLDRSYRDFKSSDMQKEINAVIDWYGKMSDIHYTNSQAMAHVEEMTEAQIQGIRDKYKNEEIEKQKQFTTELENTIINSLSDPIEREIELHRIKYERLREMAEGNKQALDTINKAEALDRARVEDFIREKRIQNAKDALSNTTSNLKAIAGQWKVFAGIYKGIAITQGLWDTYSSAIAAYKSAAAIPLIGYIAAPVAAAAAVGAGLANIAQIRKAQFASGTYSAPGGLSLVGEQGPELMDLPRGTVIYNNRQTQSMLSNSTVLHVNIFDRDGSVIREIEAKANDGDADNLIRIFSERAKRL